MCANSNSRQKSGIILSECLNLNLTHLKYASFAPPFGTEGLNEIQIPRHREVLNERKDGCESETETERDIYRVHEVSYFQLNIQMLFNKLARRKLKIEPPPIIVVCTSITF